MVQGDTVNNFLSGFHDYSSMFPSRQLVKSSMSKVGELRNYRGRGVSGTERQSSTCRMKR